MGSDLSVGVSAAVAEYTRRLDSDVPPVEIPDLAAHAPAEPVRVVDLPLSRETLAALRREAARQRASVSELVAHSVLIYLAEIDRMTPASVV